MHEILEKIPTIQKIVSVFKCVYKLNELYIIGDI